jgi:hypothetical protein
MTKKEFIKMIKYGDVDDTDEYWGSVYDVIYLTGWNEKGKQMVELMKHSMKK